MWFLLYVMWDGDDIDTHIQPAEHTHDVSCIMNTRRQLIFKR